MVKCCPFKILTPGFPVKGVLVHSTMGVFKSNSGQVLIRIKVAEMDLNNCILVDLTHLRAYIT
jgi:hypothetical protein